MPVFYQPGRNVTNVPQPVTYTPKKTILGTPVTFTGQGNAVEEDEKSSSRVDWRADYMRKLITQQQQPAQQPGSWMFVPKPPQLQAGMLPQTMATGPTDWQRTVGAVGAGISAGVGAIGAAYNGLNQYGPDYQPPQYPPGFNVRKDALGATHNANIASVPGRPGVYDTTMPDYAGDRARAEQAAGAYGYRFYPTPSLVQQRQVLDYQNNRTGYTRPPNVPQVVDPYQLERQQLQQQETDMNNRLQNLTMPVRAREENLEQLRYRLQQQETDMINKLQGLTMPVRERDSNLEHVRYRQAIMDRQRNYQNYFNGLLGKTPVKQTGTGVGTGFGYPWGGWGGYGGGGGWGGGYGRSLPKWFLDNFTWRI